MKATIGIAIASGVLAVTFAGVASAQEGLPPPVAPPPHVEEPSRSSQPEVPPPPPATVVVPAPVVVETTPSYLRAPLRAPREAFELGLGTSYTQGFGNIAAARRLRDIAGGGIDLGLTLGYRSSPGVGLGLTTSYQQFRTAPSLRKGTDVRGAAMGVQASFHLAPFERVDPVLSLGTGYRFFWTAPPGPRNNVLTHGFELAKVSAGLDIRVSDSVALGPFLGGGLNYFVWQNPEGPQGNQKLQNRRVNSFVFAGLQGRFDLGGKRQEKLIAVGSR